ncbi:MAG: ABC transporter substrate-binding protein [Cyclobacteriaceae bacterium]
MNRTIRLGILSTYSTIYPTLSQDFMDGIWSGIPEKLHRYFQFIPEYVRYGEPSALKPAMEKLLSFQNVDLLTGMASYRSMSQLVPNIERFKKTCLFADMGEYVPFLKDQSPYIFYNSFQSWQSEYAMGYWAQKKFGGRGMFMMSTYESGYHMHNAFHEGVQVAEPSSMDMIIMKHTDDMSIMPEDVLAEYMENLRKERPDYIHALFSGDEALDFFKAFHKEGLHKFIPLVVTAPMGAYELLNQISNLDMTFYAASIWDLEIQDDSNKKFKQAFIQRTGRMPNMFALLGYEIGLALEQLYPYFQNNEPEKAQKMLAEKTFLTPRGEQSFNIQSQFSTPVIDIEKINVANNVVSKMVIEQGKSLPYNHKVFETIQENSASGFFNSYLSV